MGDQWLHVQLMWFCSVEGRFQNMQAISQQELIIWVLAPLNVGLKQKWKPRELTMY